MSLTCFDHLDSSFPLAYLSIDVTGALVPYPPKCVMLFGRSFLCTRVSVRRRDRCTRTPIIHFLFGARPFLLSSHRFAFCLTLVERTMLCSNFVGAALCLFGGLVFLACVALRDSCVFVVFVLGVLVPPSEYLVASVTA